MNSQDLVNIIEEAKKEEDILFVGIDTQMAEDLFDVVNFLAEKGYVYTDPDSAMHAALVYCLEFTNASINNGLI